jgi:hypothetical protein
VMWSLNTSSQPIEAVVRLGGKKIVFNNAATKCLGVQTEGRLDGFCVEVFG